MLAWEGVAVDTGAEEGEFVHGFIHPQAFVVWPGEVGLSDNAGHLFVIFSGDKADEFGRVFGVDGFEDFVQLDACPGDIHGPGFDAAETVGAFFLKLGEFFEDIIE